MVYLISPHIDDAIFSLGNMLSSESKEQHAEIINCFSISDYVLARNKLDKHFVTEMRKSEDLSIRNALNNLSLYYLDLEDAPLRNETIRQNIPLMPLNQALAETIEKTITCIAAKGSLIYCPLAIGNHIDHLICLEAGIGLALTKQYRVCFYEDLPYAYRSSKTDMLARILYVEYRIKKKLTYKACSSAAIDVKRKLIMHYRSQIDDKIISEILEYSKINNGEKVWSIV